MKKRKGKKKNCSLDRSETKVYKHLRFAMNVVLSLMFRTMLEKIGTIQKKILWIGIYVSYIFIQNYHIYLLLFEKKSYFVIFQLS